MITFTDQFCGAGGADDPDAARRRIERMNGLERMTLRTAGELLAKTAHDASAASLDARRERDRLTADPTGGHSAVSKECRGPFLPGADRPGVRAHTRRVAYGAGQTHGLARPTPTDPGSLDSPCPRSVGSETGARS